MKNLANMSGLLTSWILLYFCLLLLLLFLTHKLFSSATTKKPTSQPPELPGTYPLIGSFLSLRAHTKDRLDWLTTLLRSSSSSTVIARHPLNAGIHLITADPANVEHILKTKFPAYPKGTHYTSTLSDLLGAGIFNVDGQEWKFQRQTASYEFTTKSLRKFVEHVVDTELNSRLLPILESAASEQQQVLDLQDILRRFAFDNICKIAFGYDPECLLPSLPESQFANAFDSAVGISGDRFKTFFPLLWRLKRFLNVGSERELKESVSLVRDLARTIVRQKINSISSESESDRDLLSRFITAGQTDERLLTDIVISFILAGRDTTSAALTWFFWLISKHPRVERKILDEIKSIDDHQENHDFLSTGSNSYDEAKKEMIYTQAALFESMRLYPPVPADFKQAVEDDKWPDGTVVVAGTTLSYHVYAMGRMERISGENWAVFEPERWLEERVGGDGVVRLRFVSKDPYSYPVFQAGPRICLGKEMAVLQMKRIVSGVLKQFRIVPAACDDGFVPVFLPGLTSRMEGGFPVKFVVRSGSAN